MLVWRCAPSVSQEDEIDLAEFLPASTFPPRNP